MQRPRRPAYVLALIAGLFLSSGTQSWAQARVSTVASFSILGDLVRAIGGDHVSIETIVPAGNDAHVFSPTPAHAKALAGAQVIFVNGLGFEGWLNRLIKSSGTKAETVVVSQGANLIPRDPHAWQDVRNVKVYAENIRDTLGRVDPGRKAAYDAAAADYLAQLDKLDAEVRATLGRIPLHRRKVITTHDAFQYFGQAYGMQFLAPEGVSTSSEASAEGVARIVKQIKTNKIPAVFLENLAGDRLIQQIARDTGAAVGGKLYSDALSGPDGPAATYLAMVRHNTRELAAALSQSAVSQSE